MTMNFDEIRKADAVLAKIRPVDGAASSEIELMRHHVEMIRDGIETCDGQKVTTNAVSGLLTYQRARNYALKPQQRFGNRFELTKDETYSIADELEDTFRYIMGAGFAFGKRCSCERRD